VPSTRAPADSIPLRFAYRRRRYLNTARMGRRGAGPLESGSGRRLASRFGKAQRFTYRLSSVAVFKITVCSCSALRRSKLADDRKILSRGALSIENILSPTVVSPYSRFAWERGRQIIVVSDAGVSHDAGRGRNVSKAQGCVLSFVHSIPPGRAASGRRERLQLRSITL
jgi:hypothetical protein